MCVMYLDRRRWVYACPCNFPSNVTRCVMEPSRSYPMQSIAQSSSPLSRQLNLWQKPTFPPCPNPFRYQSLSHHRRRPQPPTRLHRLLHTQPRPRPLLLSTILALVKRQQLATRVAAFVGVARAEGFEPVVPREGFEAKTRGVEGGEDGGPGNAGWLEDVVDGAVGGCGQVDELDDALGGVVGGEPRDSLVEFGKDTDRVCTLASRVRAGEAGKTSERRTLKMSEIPSDSFQIPFVVSPTI